MSEIAGNTVIQKIADRLSHLTGDAIDQKKSKALEKLSLTGLPAIKDEEYKFTNITKVLEKQFNLTSRDIDSSKIQAIIDDAFISELDVIKLVFVNGDFASDFSDDLNANGMSISTIKTAIEDKSEDFTSAFGTLTSGNRDAFAQMNTALTEDGVFIKVDKNAVIEKPIAVYNINASNGEAQYNNYRNLIIADVNSNATFLEFNLSDKDSEVFANVTTEIIVNENAHIHYYTLQNDHDKAFQLNNLEVLQHRSSVFSAYTFTLSGAIVRNNLNVAVDGEGCETHMFGLYVLDGKTHVDNHTAVDHIQPNSFSNELYKGILEDNSKGVFNGKVYVRQEAQKTNAFQSNKNILLSDSAVVNTKPQLEIWADDVKCSHGCTTGQLDEEALFYLRARGMSKASARAMLLYAFAIEVLDNVKIESLKSYLEEKIYGRLHRD